ncbi:MAG: SHOCT domain-containing protein [Liquorilactobacillus nagelii]|jgi:DNA-directed RNA polymerase subunit RPC12/RpoP|uniref:SHOCT domain-containing protein n=1 Tax=Liquorilactobacillus nagelii TaxID=82688 RepID=UPI00242BE9AB|nr:SHOCT domain-containing protein [Liquorilactobacillus nagelii]MCI1921934.1 SHOCT domain-containing protein [Liquorilactobacillus nagelii]MCI1976418.1 SHOCT domain-containing protein [Liquorilactobacillus nagelii]
MAKECSVCGSKIKTLSPKGITKDRLFVCTDCLKKIIPSGVSSLMISLNVAKMVQNKTAEEIKKLVETGNKIDLESACPKCGSTNIKLIADDTNIKDKKSVSVNINPLHPLTAFNVKDKQKKKRSKAKTLAALSTGGASLLVTGGTKSGKKYKIMCLNCGNEWLTNSIKNMNFNNSGEQQPASQPISSQVSIPDEIAKYKKLADNGTITQEEFEAKKKQLLNL